MNGHDAAVNSLGLVLKWRLLVRGREAALVGAASFLLFRGCAAIVGVSMACSRLSVIDGLIDRFEVW
jgi:hypothetical protein